MSMSDGMKPLDRFWDFRSALLTFALIFVAASRLAVTEWTPHLGMTQTLGVLGVALGLALGYSVFPPSACRWLGFAYGFIIVSAQWLTMVERTEWLYQDLGNMFLRLLDALTLIVKNEPVYDPFFFVALATIGFWNIGLYSGYQLTRNKNFIGALLPPGIVMLIVQVYDTQSPLRVWSFALYIFIALTLLGRLYYLENKNQWMRKRVFFTSDMEGDIARAAWVFAAVAILAAWSFPGVLSSVQPAASAWTKMTQPIRDRLSDAMSALDSPYRSPISGDFYGTSLMLGSKAPTSKQSVFYVQVDKVPPESLRYYWRGRIYDQYIEGRWSNAELTRQKFSPDVDQLLLSDAIQRYDAKFTVTLKFAKQELMYAPPNSVWVDRPGRLLLAPADNSTQEPIAWLASPGLVAGDKYQIRARVANPNEEDLRGAGNAYPQWVKDRYLQIPEEMQPQLKELAERVTRSEKTPYDQAQALTSFLRQEIQYSKTLNDSPASGQDPVMWVLFEYKKGFCMYSASAEVLLLRSLGIPARMAVGFAQGRHDSKRNGYAVSQLDSHAWPEVYFPDIGWVEFEPTGNQAPLIRPRKPLPQTTEEESLKPREPAARIEPDESAPAEQTPPPENRGMSFEWVARFLYPLLLTGLFALGIFIIQRYSLIDRLPVYLEGKYAEKGRQPPSWLKRWSKWATLPPIQRAFHAVDMSLRLLKNPQPAHATPRERAHILTQLLPAARESIAALQEEHESALFTNHAGNTERARRASRKVIFETWRVRLFKSKIQNR